MQQSYEHLKSMLWGEPGSHVYAFIQGSVVPGLRQRLAGAGLRDWDCLWRGALAPADQERAPYIAELTSASPFTDWLLTEAGGAYPGWGVVGVSREPMLVAREHGRGLLKVGLPGGEQRTWNWLDPMLWGELLPRLDAMQLGEAFGCMNDWVLVSSERWQWFTLSAGQLGSTVRQCLPPAQP
jgi:hypothetical protein